MRSTKEVAVSGPTRKRKIGDVLSSLGGKAGGRNPRVAVKVLKGLLEHANLDPSEM